jgi:hypothetical protein
MLANKDGCMIKSVVFLKNGMTRLWNRIRYNYLFNNKIRDKIYKIKDAYAYYKRGFSNEDWIEYSVSNAERTIKALRYFQKHGISYPCKIESRDEWELILDKIIFAWEEMLANITDVEHVEKITYNNRFISVGEFYTEMVINDKKIAYNYRKNYILRNQLVGGNRRFYKKDEMFYVQTREDYERMLKGFELYIKYYASLWD